VKFTASEDAVTLCAGLCEAFGYAQSWVNKARDDQLMAQVKPNPHSPPVYRINGVVVHMPAFYDAFDLKPGDPMYLAPELRVSLW
jgi:endothelin-converting enzyme/putative endopeptidase